MRPLLPHYHKHHMFDDGIYFLVRLRKNGSKLKMLHCKQRQSVALPKYPMANVQLNLYLAFSHSSLQVPP